MFNLRYLRKGLSLRIVNLVGLTVTVVSLVLSIGYIRREKSYDRHHSKAERIVRLSPKMEGEPLDVRSFGNSVVPLLEALPEVETYAKIHNYYSTDLEYKGMHFTKSEHVFLINEAFFDVFDIKFTAPVSEDFGHDHVYLSESYASYLAAVSSEDSMVGKEIIINQESAVVAGIYEDFPETSHFRADALIFRTWFGKNPMFCYHYLLLKEGTDVDALEEKMTDMIRVSGLFKGGIYEKPVSAFLMPLTEIHLHSHFIREFENNGNVIYIYLVICANVLLVLIVLFNFFLNSSLILMDNEKRHRVNWILGSDRSYWLVSLAKKLNMDFGRSAKWVFLVQYAIVTLILVMTFGMDRQMEMVSRIQPGGSSVLVLNVPSDAVMEKLAVFKDELKKEPNVKGVTSVFLLPGNAVRDFATIEVSGKEDSLSIPMFVVGEDFIPFFDLELIAGSGFGSLPMDYKNEHDLLMWRLYYNECLGWTEDYIINESALPLLGFENASEAIGQEVKLSHGTVDYINKGKIAGVVKDFYYTGTLNRTEPIIMMQRNLFQSCVLVDLSDMDNGLEQVMKVWNDVYPDYVISDYEFMEDIYNDMYSNERNALSLMRAFAIICFIITDLGLIVFMAYIVKRRRKEIALRKVNGATSGNIVTMLNLYYLKYILIAFAIAAPLAYWLLDRWLQTFAYRIAIDWWMFAFAVLTLILISAASVSIQSLRAASANPLDGIREN